MKKKKIIFFHPYSVFGGADLSISKLIKSCPSDFDIDFLTISKNPKIKFYVKRKFKLIKLKSNKTIFSIFRIRDKLKNDLINYEKVILISNQNFANILSIIACFNLKRVKTVLFERNHLSELDNNKSLKLKLKNGILKLCIKIFYKFSDLIITNSYESSKDLQKFINSKVLTIQNFYNFDELKKKSKLRLEKKIKFKKNIVLNVGRFEDQKDQIILLKAFKILNKINKNINLLLIGDGSKLNFLRNYINQNKLHNNIQILTGIKNSLPYFKNCNLYFSTSKYEGFPNALVEATFFKLPIISTFFKSGLNEILKNEKGGVILKNKSSRHIADKIQWFFKKKNQLAKKQLYAKKNLKNFNYHIGERKFKKIILKI